MKLSQNLDYAYAVKRRWSTAGEGPARDGFAPSGSNLSGGRRNETVGASGAWWATLLHTSAALNALGIPSSVTRSERDSKEVNSMKQLAVMLFTLVLSVPRAVIAQEPGTQQPAGSTTSSTTKGAKLQHLKGKVSDDGKSFTVCSRCPRAQGCLRSRFARANLSMKFVCEISGNTTAHCRRFHNHAWPLRRPRSFPPLRSE